MNARLLRRRFWPRINGRSGDCFEDPGGDTLQKPIAAGMFLELSPWRENARTPGRRSIRSWIASIQYPDLATARSGRSDSWHDQLLDAFDAIAACAARRIIVMFRM